MNFDPFHDTNLENITDLLDGDSFLYVRFTKSGTEQVSKDYRVTNIAAGAIAQGQTNPAAVFFSIDGQFESDVNFIYDDANNLIFSGTKINFYRKRSEHSPKFDGRFFAKILDDEERSSTDSKILWAITGIMTLSSKFPD